MNNFCEDVDCTRLANCVGRFCIMHYKRWKRNGSTDRVRQETGYMCPVEGCTRSVVKGGLCDPHYQMQRLYGRTQTIKGVYGEGRQRDSQGYPWIWDERLNESRPAHIVVAEKALGKRLPPGAIVHHVDEDKLNYAGTNLVICPNQAYHMLIHQRMRDYDSRHREELKRDE